MPCQTCSHPQRQAIDQALLAENHTVPALSQTYGLSISSLFRHKNHLVEKMRQARQRLRDSQHLVSLLKLNAYLDHVQRAVQTAEADGNVNLVLKGAQVGSRIIRQISQMDVPLELDTVYRLISSPQWVSQDSLLPTDPQIIIAIHQSLAEAAFFPCPDEEPEILPKNQREKSAKLPKNLTLPSKNILQNQLDGLCEKITPKNPLSSPQPSITHSPQSPVSGPPSPVLNPPSTHLPCIVHLKTDRYRRRGIF